MSRLEGLHPDQRAVLQLLLRRGLDYAALADALGLAPELVRERALDAVDGLAPEDVEGLELEDRDRIADYLLGQQPASERQATRELLESSAPARTWARLVAGELRPLAGDDLPAVPGDGEDVREAFAALDARTTAEGRQRKRRGVGTILLTVAAALVVAAIVLWVAGVFDGDDDSGSDAADAPATTTSTTASAAALQAIAAELRQQVNLNPPKGAKGAAARPKAVAQLTAQDGQLLALLQGQGFRAASKDRTYAVWLTGGSGGKAVRLGWFSNGEKDQNGQTTPKTIDSKGRIQGTLLPLQVGKDVAAGQEVQVDPRDYSRMVVAEETSSTIRGNKPGRTIVSGALKP